MTIAAKIIADSINLQGTRLTTLELEYPRFIHAEFMTHRMLSKNSASSRAIPIAKMHQNIIDNPGMPIHWGKNQPGMSAKEEVENKDDMREFWITAQEAAIKYSKLLSDAGLHKQVANRVTEPFQTMKVVVSATEWENFFWLRDHPDAQPEIQELAKQVKDVMQCNVPTLLGPEEWHLPYVETKLGDGNNMIYCDAAGNEYTLAEAKKVSASCCAQVSYRTSDTSLSKAEMIYDKLINSSPVHASPVEHQATPMSDLCNLQFKGVTHMRFDGTLWSGNFKNWIQLRQTIDNHCKW